jgi:hypothetical protein
MSQAAGFRGTPLAGQVSTAVTKAAWTASSAASMSPRRRIRVASSRPYSSRKVASMVGRTSVS